MIFRLKKLDYNKTNKFTPQSQIIEHIYCDKCDNRELSRMGAGLTLQGLQLWCDNCNKSILHLRFEGEIIADPLPQGRFNERNSHDGSEKMTKYNLSSQDLKKKWKEEKTNSDVDVSNISRRTLPRL